MRVVRSLAVDREAGGDFGETLRKRLHRTAQQRDLAFEMRQQIVGFEGHTRSGRRRAGRMAMQRSKKLAERFYSGN
ncbi:hypothetical protein [Burkholderia anthina]|uniref:hypothetical protein n=1 Tax=Burkholderia anthina TaxID=179879 RepID=UPI001EF0B4D4|nr:hypothetical protein [Burkholderia anthina]